MAFVQPAQLERTEVDVPEAVINLFEAHVLAGADDGNIDPVGVPADPAVGADVTELKAVGIFERRQFGGHFA